MRASFHGLPVRASSADQPVVGERPERILWRPIEMAAALGISLRLLQKLTADGTIPAIRLRSCCRYHAPTVEAALAKLTTTT